MGEDDTEDRYVTKIFRKVRQTIPVRPKESEEEPVEAEPVPQEPLEVVEAEPVETKPVQTVPVEPQVLGPPPPEEKKGFFTQFPKLYWVADALELFERGAYYGMLAVMSVHMANNLGIDAVTIGLLFSMLLFFSYFWPLFASALAEKYGYRQVIMVAFGLLISGYFMTSTLRAGNLPLFVAALLLMGFGAGTFKPLISATIAHVTKSEQRNLAYSLYYWFINFGAFIFPLLLGFAFPAEESYYWIFVVSGILIGVNVVITFIWFTNPMEPQRDLSVPQAFKKIMPALQDRKFLMLLIIYSGFWFMYAVNHSFLPIYMLDFRRMPASFTVQWLAIINPGTIILVGPFLGKIMEKYKSLNVMMLGIIIYCIGVILTFGSNSMELFVAGIIVYSIGEFIVHPGFIAYVSKIAPKDKVAIYMGAIFISTGVGIVAGPAIMGIWYAGFVEEAHMPKLFGTLIISVGFFTFASFILYNRWINNLAKQEDPTYQVDTSIWSKVTTAAVVLLLIPAVIYAGFVAGTDTFYGQEDDDDGGDIINWAEDYDLISGNQISLSGYANENSDTEQAVEIPETNVASMNFTLTWTDEPDTQYLLRTYENEPDSFSLSVSTPDNRTLREGPEFNAHGEQGEVLLTVPFYPDEDPDYNGTGSFTVIIECGACGDSFTTGLVGFTDSGNDWQLTVDYEYYQKKE